MKKQKMKASSEINIGMSRCAPIHESTGCEAAPDGQRPSCSGLLSDLHAFDPNTMIWTDLSTPAFGDAPSARYGHGFTSAGRRLYVHGGNNGSGRCCGI